MHMHLDRRPLEWLPHVERGMVRRCCGAPAVDLSPAPSDVQTGRLRAMSIDFRLTKEQQDLRDAAQDFAQNVLAPLVPDADRAADPHEAFAKTKPAYVEAYKRGLAMGFLPKEYGGGSVGNLDLQLVAEEICAVDPGFATTILVNGLGLMNVVWFGTEAEKKKWLGPACTDPKSEYLAGWVVSEAAGRPGGTANFDAPQASPVGIGLTAELAKGEYVLNGRKYWPCNAGGWDKQGADMNVCRSEERRVGQGWRSGGLC